MKISAIFSMLSRPAYWYPNQSTEHKSVFDVFLWHLNYSYPLTCQLSIVILTSLQSTSHPVVQDYFILSTTPGAE